MEIEDWIKEEIQTMKKVAKEEWFTDWSKHTQDIQKVGNDLINVPNMGVAPIIDSFASDFVVWNWIADGDNYAHSKAITIYCVLGLDGELYYAWQYPKADYNHQWFFTSQDMEGV